MVNKSSRYVNTRKCFAFTLAEVLITLAIIGIVAAMTIPTLVQKYQEKATVVKLKKFYSVFSSAILMAKSENGELTSWGITPDETGMKLIIDKLRPYLKITTDCGIDANATENCKLRFDGLNGIRGSSSSWFDNADRAYNLILADGNMLRVSSEPCLSRDNGCIGVRVAVNNKKTKILGKDVFNFSINGNGEFSNEGEGAPMDASSWANCNLKQEGWYCGAWILYKGNMDYLHCSDLDWNTKNSCK